MSRAIRALRERAGPGGKKLSTEAAGRRLGVTRQTWEKYEGDKADVVLRQDVQADIARALEVPVTDLKAAYTRALVAEGFGAGELAEVEADPFEPAMGANTRRLLMPDDNLRPWASSGTIIVYDVAQWPRSDDGCVLELSDGTRQVKIFLRADAEAYHVAELAPERRELRIPRDQARAYRVVARIS